MVEKLLGMTKASSLVVQSMNICIVRWPTTVGQAGTTHVTVPASWTALPDQDCLHTIPPREPACNKTRGLAETQR